MGRRIPCAVAPFAQPKSGPYEVMSRGENIYCFDTGIIISGKEEEEKMEFFC